jgi:hypothetical protein
VGIPVVLASVEPQNRTIFWQLPPNAINVYHNITGIYEHQLASLPNTVFKTEEMIVYKYYKVPKISWQKYLSNQNYGKVSKMRSQENGSYCFIIT